MRHLRAGCTCLGLHLRPSPTPPSARSGSTRWIQPSPDAIRQLKRTRKGLWRTPVGSPPVALMHAMHPVSSGGSTSGRLGVAKEVCTAWDGFLDRRAQRSRPRRHPSTSGWGSPQKYGGRLSGPQDRWGVQEQARHGTRRTCAWTTIIRHRRVPATSAPADPTRPDSWRPRRQRTDGTTGRAGPLARRPHGRGPVGHQALDHGAEVHVHHVRPKRHGGTDDLTHLRRVQHPCPRQMHRSRAPLGVRRWREPCPR
jgi:RNA-directed DNA polymerase